MNAAQNMKTTLCSLDDLPALPGVALEILDQIRDTEKPLARLAEILATDPPLSAKVLNVVNSPFFGLARKITNLPHAVNLLGEESLKYIALSFSLVNVFKDTGKYFDYTGFWQKSLACAVLCRLIARDTGRPDAEDLYFLGLIHDIGILAMVRSHPGQYAMVEKKITWEGVSRHIAENETFGYNHMEVGAYLIETWGLPTLFTAPLVHHHHPANIPPERENDEPRAQILHLADEICNILYAPEKTVHLAIANRLIDEYGLSRKISLEALAEETEYQIRPLMPLFDIDRHSDTSYAKILEDSKREMYRLSFDMLEKIRQQQQTIENLSILASRDGLTRLNNYKSFKDAMEREMAGTRRYGYTSVLALADLDAFKAVNDTYGHLAGDHVLQEIGRFFTENIRDSDFVARYGGEEFAFILTKTTVEDGYKTLDRLRAMLSRLRIEYQGHCISVTMSVGVTGFRGDADAGATDLLRQADAAMYRAKNAGRNRIFVF